MSAGRVFWLACRVVLALLFWPILAAMWLLVFSLKLSAVLLRAAAGQSQR